MLAMFAMSGTAWFLIGLAPTYLWLLMAFGLVGLVRGAANPVGNKLILLHAPKATRGLTMGVSKSGAQVTAFLVGIILPTLALAVGWRGTMVGSGLLAAIGIFITLRVVPPDPKTPPSPSGGGRTGGGRNVTRYVLPHAFLVGLGSGGFTAYLALFAHEGVGLALATAGALVSATAVVGIVARVVWGRQADRFASTALPLLLVTAAGGIALLILGAASDARGVWVWVGAILFAASAGSWIPVGMLAVIRESPSASTGKMSGIVLGVFYAGIAASPLAFGLVVDMTGSYPAAWFLNAGALLFAAMVAFNWHLRAGRVGPRAR